MRTNTRAHLGIIFNAIFSLILVLSFATTSLAKQFSEDFQSSLADYLTYLPLVLRDYYYSCTGLLDPSFDTDGLVTTEFGNDDFGMDVVIQPDGKIVMAGRTGASNIFDFAVARYNQEGSPDLTFNSSGRATTDFNGRDDRATSVAIQTDGKIVVFGIADSVATFYDFALARYNPDGSLDTTFNGDGRVTTDFGGSSDYGYDVAIQPDGKIIVAGSAYDLVTDEDFALVRYNPDGSLDASFGGDGRVTTDLGSVDEEIHALILQPDGKIIVVGNAFSTSNYNNFAMARYNPDGSLDATFGTSGLVTTDFNHSADWAVDVALTQDGKIVAAGYSIFHPYYIFSLARYNPDGSLDITFDGDGRVTTDFGAQDDFGSDVMVQPDGKIVVAGRSRGVSTYDFALARYNHDGSLDTTLDGDGRVTTNFNTNSDDYGNAIVLQSDNRIIVAGYASTDGPDPDFALARYK